MSEKLTHIALAKELGDMIRRHSKEPDQIPALQETIRTWWHLRLAARHYEDVKTILDDLRKIDELLATDISSEERAFLVLTEKVLTSEGVRHQSEVDKLIAAVGGCDRYGMLASMFPHLDEYVHIVPKESKR